MKIIPQTSTITLEGLYPFFVPNKNFIKKKPKKKTKKQKQKKTCQCIHILLTLI